MTRRSLQLCLLLAFFGCAQEERGQTIPYAETPSSMGWLDVPWPSDLRLNANGRPRLFSYPDPQASELVRAAIALAESRRGFALQPTIYLELGGQAAPELLALDPEEALQADAPIQLLALDGPPERRPLLIAQGGANDWMTPTTLHARPLFGWPLRPRQRYALVATKALQARDASAPFRPVELIQQGLAGQGAQASYLAPLRARLTDYGLATDQILVATVFTTADPLEEFRSLSDAQRALPTPALSAPWAPPEPPAPRVYEAEYRAPLWQHGAKPYASEGGGFVFEGDAPVQATSDEVMRLAISIPQGEPPERGWPVVIYHHGTGGSYRSFLESSGSFAQDLNRQGLAMIGLDQPLHGLRAVAGTNTEWHTFNPFNLEASAANLRQGALDLLLLHRMIQEGALNSAEPRIALDPQRIFLFGHSQGGLTGALALPELAELPCAIMSGTGGALSLTLLERKDPINIAEALAGWGGAQTPLFASHPLISLIQHAFEPSDPITAAPAWQTSGLHHLLLTSGQRDQQTPASTADALAMAALIPQIEPIANDLWRQELEGISPQSGSLSANAVIGDQRITAAYRQSQGGDHFVIFNSTPLRRMVTRFLTSCAAGQPTVSGR